MEFIHIRKGEVNIKKSINITHYITDLREKKNTGSSRCRKKPFDTNLTIFQDGTLNKLQTINYTNIKAMALHSSTLAWKIPWMEEPGRL